MPATSTSDEVVPGSPEHLASTALPLLRAFATIADESLTAVMPSMTLQQFRALTVLCEHGPQSAASLAAALGIAPSTLSRLANRLVRDGIADRVVDPDDRRAVVLSVTRRGARIAERVKAWRLGELSRHFAELPRGDRSETARALALAGALFREEEG